MQENKAKKSRVPLVVVAVVLALGIAVGAFLVFSGALEAWFAPPREAAVHFSLEGDIDAVTVAAHGEDTTEDGMRLYYSEAVAHAVANGFDTIIYEGKTDITVLWRDTVFPMNDIVTQEDSFFKKTFDPLEILVETATASGVQVYVGFDPLTSLKYDKDMKGKVADLAPAWDFAPDDAAYASLLEEGVVNLARYYGIAGVLFQNVGDRAGEFAPVVASIGAALEEAAPGVKLAVEILHTGEVAVEYAAAYLAQPAVDFVILEVDGQEGYVGRLAALDDAGSFVLRQSPESKSTRVLFAAGDLAGYHGIAMGHYPHPWLDAGEITQLRVAATQVEGTKPAGYELPQTLSVTNPGYGMGFNSTSLYIVGTSDPAQPLYVDGDEVTQRTETGLFGVLVDLDYGENYFTFTQGGEAVEWLVKNNIARSADEGGGSAGQAADPVYTTREAEENEAVVVTFQFTSAYEDSAGGIPNEMFYEGAVAKVQSVLLKDAVPTAYQISGGDWVYTSEVARTTWENPAFTGLALRQLENGDEYIDFVGAGTPAAYVHYEETDNTLRITMHDTSFTLDGGFSSGLVSGARIGQEDGAAVLTLELGDVWGYQLEYADGGTTVYLKAAPRLTGDPAKPLEGVTIMLDPGHGDHDNGAWMAIIGAESEIGGPYEKHLTLDVAQATAYRLRQLGAEVVMTRDDDSYTDVYERLAFQNEVKPDLYISLHYNSFDPYSDLTEYAGTEAYYYHPYAVANARGLAENLVNSLTNATGLKNRGAKWGYYVVTRTTVCPSVLCEYAFVSNLYEYEAVISAEGIYTQADATVAAIVATLYGQTVEYSGGGDEG